MNRYQVTIKPITDETEPGAFAGLRYESAEFEDFDDDGNEVHTVTSDIDLSQAFDTNDAVVSYIEL